MKMTKLTFAGATLAAMTTLAVNSATASTLDFTTAPYASTFFGPDANVTTDTVDGVNFTITATARGVDGFRQVLGGGLQFGLPGNGMFTIAITADQDLTFNNMFGHGHGFPQQISGQLAFNIDVDGVSQSVGNMFTSTALETVSFVDGPISVLSGQSFLFAIDYSVFVGSNILASADVRSFDFTVATTTTPSPVPLPAGLPLLMAGLGAFGFLRKKRK